MGYRITADLLLIAHLLFIVFALLGGLLILWRRWWLALHLPAIGWVILLESNGWICPLTPWENQLRRLAGEGGYDGGFIEHYLIPLIYPAGLTHQVQLLLAAIALLINLLIYGGVIYILIRRAKHKP